MAMSENTAPRGSCCTYACCQRQTTPKTYTGRANRIGHLANSAQSLPHHVRNLTELPTRAVLAKSAREARLIGPQLTGNEAPDQNVGATWAPRPEHESPLGHFAPECVSVRERRALSPRCVAP